MPDWLAQEDTTDTPITTLRIGAAGLHKSINVGLLRSDSGTNSLSSFLDIARHFTP